MSDIRAYSSKEEMWSSIIHGIGIGLSIAGLVLLVVFASLYADVWAIVSTAIFGASMIVLYTASTLYHAFRDEKIKKKLENYIIHC